jgi:hypothetical protein
MEDRMDNQSRSDGGSTAGGARGKARQKAAEMAGKAKEQLSGRFDEQKSRATSEVSQLASALRRAGDDLAGGSIGSAVLGRVASRLESLGSAVEGKSLDDLVTDVERLARRNPALFVGGAMLIGFAASRFLKSSSRAGYRYEEETGLDLARPGDFRSDFFQRGSDSWETTGNAGGGSAGGGTGSSSGGGNL